MKKIALITGASSGIGAATAREFAQNGIDLILCGRREDRLLSIKEELSAKVNVIHAVFDVRNEKDVIESLNGIPESFKAIDILVNNAGNAHGLGPIHEGSSEDWDMMMDANVKGLLYVTRYVSKLMVSRKCGHIINVSSIAGKETYQNGTVYCGSKAAVESISKGLRLELVPHGIKVTNIAPGAVDTEFSMVRFKNDKNKADLVYRGFEPLLAKDIANSIWYCINQPSHVQIADLTIFASAQSAATSIHREDT